MNTQEIAQTILAQLGGRQFIAMTGAKDLVALSAGGISMKIGRNGKGVSHVRIVLDYATDTYNVEFCKWNARALEMKTLSKHDGIYCDMLRDLFTAETGLYTSLRG